MTSEVNDFGLTARERKKVFVASFEDLASASRHTGGPGRSSSNVSSVFSRRYQNQNQSIRIKASIHASLFRYMRSSIFDPEGPSVKNIYSRARQEKVLAEARQRC